MEEAGDCGEEERAVEGREDRGERAQATARAVSSGGHRGTGEDARRIRPRDACVSQRGRATHAEAGPEGGEGASTDEAS